MKYAKWLLLLLLAVLFLSAYKESIQHNETGKWVSLFNGKDLNGWTPRIVGYGVGENFGNTFRVEDGILSVRYNAYDSFSNRY